MQDRCKIHLSERTSVKITLRYLKQAD